MNMASLIVCSEDNQYQTAGADPALVGGGENSSDGDAHRIYLTDFLKNPMKLQEFWSLGGGALPFPLDPPLDRGYQLRLSIDLID